MHELGRRHAPDERDRLYLLREAIHLPALEECPNWKYWYPRFNQDQTGPTCVANGWTHRLGDSPKTWPLAWLDTITERRTLVDKDAVPLAIPDLTAYTSPYSGQRGFRGLLYDQAQLIDEWSDTPPEGGTSVRAGAKILQRWGFLQEYRWLASGEEVLRAVLSLGPVVIGVTWYESMFPSPGGWLKIDESQGVAGGHCVVIDGGSQTSSPKKARVQTWGTHYWIDLETLDRLILDQGEAVIPIETL